MAKASRRPIDTDRATDILKLPIYPNLHLIGRFDRPLISHATQSAVAVTFSESLMRLKFLGVLAAAGCALMLSIVGNSTIAGHHGSKGGGHEIDDDDYCCPSVCAPMRCAQTYCNPTYCSPSYCAVSYCAPSCGVSYAPSYCDGSVTYSVPSYSYQSAPTCAAPRQAACACPVEEAPAPAIHDCPECRERERKRYHDDRRHDRHYHERHEHHGKRESRTSEQESVRSLHRPAAEDVRQGLFEVKLESDAPSTPAPVAAPSTPKGTSLSDESAAVESLARKVARLRQ